MASSKTIAQNVVLGPLLMRLSLKRLSAFPGMAVLAAVSVWNGSKPSQTELRLST
jgi:hypothetical protein